MKSRRRTIRESSDLPEPVEEGARVPEPDPRERPDARDRNRSRPVEAAPWEARALVVKHVP